MTKKIISAFESLDEAMKIATSARVRKDLADLKAKLPPSSQPSLEFLRIQAIRNDVGENTQRILDLVDVPFVSQADASRLSAHAIDSLHVNAFKELQRQHPGAMHGWLSEMPAIGNLKIAYGLVHGKLTKKRRTMFALATLFGADWSLHRPDIAKNSPDRLEIYDEVVAWAVATSMQCRTSSAPSTPGRRF